MMWNLFYFDWLNSVLEYTVLSAYIYNLYFSIFISFSLFLLYLLILSSTIFISLLLLVLLFIVQIIFLYTIGQQLFALFLLGVYVGAILVFFIFVVMSFIFFGKSYKLSNFLWVLFSIIHIIYIYIMYGVMYSGAGEDSYYYVYNIYNIYVFSIDELQVVGFLLFDIDMMYIVVVVSLLLLVALLGSITFNASSLVRYKSTFYIYD